MFYVTDIAGALVPFEPGVTPLSVSVPSVRPTAAVSPTSTAQTFPQTIKPLLAEVSTNRANLNQEAAVFEGHVALVKTAPTGLSDSGNISRAGAAAAYQSAESAGTAKVHTEELVPHSSSISPLDSIDEKHGALHLVNPIKNYRQNTTDRKKVVVAGDIMSSPVFTLKENAPLEEAQKVFRDHKFRHIPIVSNNERLVGILSDRDFMGTLNHKSSGTIRTKMVTNILTAHPQTEISAIAKVMITHHIGCLPITDENGALVGILTRTDILHAIVNHAPIELWT